MLNGEYETARKLRSRSRVVDARATRTGLRPSDVDALQDFAHADAADRTVEAFAREREIGMGTAWAPPRRRFRG